MRYLIHLDESSSTRRTWIEIEDQSVVIADDVVVLHTEDVD